MVRRNTWILLAIFAVLLGGTLFLKNSGNLSFVEDEESTPSATQAPLFGINTGQISAVAIQDKAGNLVQVEQMSDGWRVAVPEGQQADPATLSGAVSGIAGWTVMNDLAIAPGVDSIGLGDPNYTLTLTWSEGQESTLKIGDITPTGSGYYVQIDGGTPVVVSQYSVSSVLDLYTTIIATPTPPGEPSPGPDDRTPQSTGTP